MKPRHKSLALRPVAPGCVRAGIGYDDSTVSELLRNQQRHPVLKASEHGTVLKGLECRAAFEPRQAQIPITRAAKGSENRRILFVLEKMPIELRSVFKLIW